MLAQGVSEFAGVNDDIHIGQGTAVMMGKATIILKEIARVLGKRCKKMTMNNHSQLFDSESCDFGN